MTYETVTKVEDLPLRYPHHRKALEELVRIFSSKDGVIALVLGGSLARGRERADSDIDAMAVVTDAFYEEKKRELHTAEMISMGDCAYPGGYFDLKYMTKDYIRDAANKGSEPTRSSFLGSKVLFSADPEVTELVGKIPIFQKQEVEEKMLSFYSDLQLSYGIFLEDQRAEELHEAPYGR